MRTAERARALATRPTAAACCAMFDYVRLPTLPPSFSLVSAVAENKNRYISLVDGGKCLPALVAAQPTLGRCGEAHHWFAGQACQLASVPQCETPASNSFGRVEALGTRGCMAPGRRRAHVASSLPPSRACRVACVVGGLVLVIVTGAVNIRRLSPAWSQVAAPVGEASRPGRWSAAYASPTATLDAADLASTRASSGFSPAEHRAVGRSGQARGGLRSKLSARAVPEAEPKQLDEPRPSNLPVLTEWEPVQPPEPLPLINHAELPDATEGFDTTATPLPNRWLSAPTERPSDAAYHAARFVFLHIHKAGGTTVRTWLEGYCQQNSLSCLMSAQWADRARLEGVQLDALDIIHGTYTFGLCDAKLGGTSRPCGYATALREPVARMVSDFEYCVRRRILYSSWGRLLRAFSSRHFDDLCSSTALLHFNRAQPPTLAEWARARGNHVLAQLRATRFDARQAADSLPHWEVTGIEYQARRQGPPTREHLDIAVRQLPRWFVVVGLTERLAESMVLWRAAFGMDAEVDAAQRVNVGLSQTEPGWGVDAYDREELEAVRQAVALDAELYQVAQRLFERQLAKACSENASIAKTIEALNDTS